MTARVWSILIDSIFVLLAAAKLAYILLFHYRNSKFNVYSEACCFELCQQLAQLQNARNKDFTSFLNQKIMA